LTVGDASRFAPLVPAAAGGIQPASVPSDVTPVPEPGTLLLLVLGFGGAALARRRGRKPTMPIEHVARHGGAGGRAGLR
jgi:hypothetical protein